VKAKELLTTCFVVFAVLLVWPVLSIPNRLVLVGGVPALVLYLFVVWGLIVAVLAWAGRRVGGEASMSASAERRAAQASDNCCHNRRVNQGIPARCSGIVPVS